MDCSGHDGEGIACFFLRIYGWARSVVGLRGFPKVLICIQVCASHFRSQGGNPTFSELIRMRPSCSIGIDTYGSVACIKGQGLDTFGNRVDPW